MKIVSSLPKSDDEFWDGDKTGSVRKVMALCDTHGKNWKDHVGYKDNHDGTASCKYCGWGFLLAGYLRVHNEKVYDLRDG
jgi:hypothetical protein